MSGLNWVQLSQSDNFLTKNLVDNLYFWIETRKVSIPDQKKVPTIDRQIIINLLKRFITGVDKPDITKCMDRFMNLPATRVFLERLSDEKRVKEEFKKHARKYFEAYFPDCGFELGTTDRYEVKSGVLETAAVARKDYNIGDEIKYLVGAFADLSPKEEEMLDTSDFSVIHLTTRDYPCLMLGPARFVNHDCDANARFSSQRNGLKIYATKKILAGQEITVQYAPSYFGKNNKDCLCATCERLGKGYYNPDRYVIPEDAVLIDIGSSGDENSNEQQKLLQQLKQDQEEQEREVIVLDSESELGETEVPEEDHGIKNSDRSPTKSEESSSASPVPIDVKEFAKARKQRERKGLKKQSSVDCSCLATDEPFVESNSEEGRRLRPREKIKMSGKHVIRKDILRLYKPDDSVDSLIVEIPNLNSELVRERRINRTLHKLLMTKLYREDDDKDDTYDCRHCGIYFKLLPDSSHKYPEYCARCIRHQLIYGLAYPEMKNKSNSTSLPLYEDVTRLPISEVKKAKPGVLTCRRPNIGGGTKSRCHRSMGRSKIKAAEQQMKIKTDHESDYFTQSSSDSDAESSIPEILPLSTSKSTTGGIEKVIGLTKVNDALSELYSDDNLTNRLKRRPYIMHVDKTPSGAESRIFENEKHFKQHKRQHTTKKRQFKLFDDVNISSRDTTPTKEEILSSMPKFSPDDLWREGHNKRNVASPVPTRPSFAERKEPINSSRGSQSGIERISEEKFWETKQEVRQEVIKEPIDSKNVEVKTENDRTAGFRKKAKFPPEPEIIVLSDTDDSDDDDDGPTPIEPFISPKKVEAISSETRSRLSPSDKSKLKPRPGTKKNGNIGGIHKVPTIVKEEDVKALSRPRPTFINTK